MEKLELDKKIIKEDCIKEVKLGINSDPTGYGKKHFQQLVCL